ncbi:MAG: hypothetical protein DME19_17605, partial [Verrucomicrobia bacterium]
MGRSVEQSVPVAEPYPEGSRERDQWVLARRPFRNAVGPRRPYAFLAEAERAESGEVVSVAAIFLTNRECPWRCLMCDLWKNTLTETVPAGAIPAQIDYALTELSRQGSAGFQPASSGDIRLAGDCREPRGSAEVRATMRQIKLYNSGSFFDPQAIPPGDHDAIARRVAGFERVIVECHPALMGESALKFRDLLNATEANGVNLPPVRELKKRPPSPRPSPRGENSPKQFSAPRALEPASRPLTPSLSPYEGERAPEGRVRGKLQGQGQPDPLDSPGLRAPLRRVDVSGDGHRHAATTKLEVAMGLETAHPQVLEKLNKRMTLDQFRRAAEFLRKNELALRVFIL